MVADFGYGVIVMAFLVALYSAGAAIYGERTKSTDWIEVSSARHVIVMATYFHFCRVADLLTDHKSF